MQPPQPNLSQPYTYAYNTGNGMMYSTRPISHEEIMSQRDTYLRQEYQYKLKRLQDAYPVKYALSNSIIVIVFSLLQIALQILAFINTVSGAYLAIGFWGALFFIIPAIVALVQSKLTNHFGYDCCLFFSFIISKES